MRGVWVGREVGECFSGEKTIQVLWSVVFSFNFPFSLFESFLGNLP